MRWAVLALVLFAFVLVPFVLFEAEFNSLAERLLRSGGVGAALAIGGLLALDIVLPIPSSLLSTAAGALLGFPLGTGVSWLGMTVASSLGYWLGTRATGATSRFVGAESLRRAERLTQRFGDWAIVASRPVPVLAEAGALLAGILRTPWPRYLALSAGANLGVSLVYAFVGAYARQWDSFLLAFAGALLLPAAGMLLAKAKLKT
jgi:uncharacterized membrane protein YdjX (TVP38/TMEM64 family)